MPAPRVRVLPCVQDFPTNKEFAKFFRAALANFVEERFSNYVHLFQERDTDTHCLRDPVQTPDQSRLEEGVL